MSAVAIGTTLRLDRGISVDDTRLKLEDCICGKERLFKILTRIKFIN